MRPAEAGEFTRRAFENGRLDLTAVEGLADLIGAETEAQRRQAYRQLKGLLGERAETWRARMIEALALVEARIDFSDEADVPEDLIGPALKIVQGLRDEIAERWPAPRAASGCATAWWWRSRVRPTPASRPCSIASRGARPRSCRPIPGTTRDVIEVHLDLDGYPVTLLDTAGIRDSDDPVEQEGVRRARQRASEADLVLWVYDAKDGPGQSEASPFSGSVTKWMVRNKVDLLASGKRNELKKNNEFRLSNIVFNLSATTGLGVAEFLAQLGDYAKSYFGAESSLLTRERHRKR